MKARERPNHQPDNVNGMNQTCNSPIAREMQTASLSFDCVLYDLIASGAYFVFSAMGAAEKRQ